MAARFESEAKPMVVNETRRLRRWPVVFAVAALACVAGPSENAAVAGEQIAQVSADATVIGLRQAGWVVTERQERNEWRPGLPPYGMLPRNVNISIFVLEKNGQRKRCRLAYDSQLETFAEECRDAE